MVKFSGKQSSKPEEQDTCRKNFLYKIKVGVQKKISLFHACLGEKRDVYNAIFGGKSDLSYGIAQAAKINFTRYFIKVSKSIF